MRRRLLVSCIGFAIGGIGLIPGALATDAETALLFLALALAVLELTVAVSWAICLDIGGAFSGSVSGVMNTLGNLGGVVSANVVAFLAVSYGWPAALLAAAVLCLIAAGLAIQIDPSAPIEQPRAEPVLASRG